MPPAILCYSLDDVPFVVFFLPADRVTITSRRHHNRMPRRLYVNCMVMARIKRHRLNYGNRLNVYYHDLILYCSMHVI